MKDKILNILIIIMFISSICSVIIIEIVPTNVENKLQFIEKHYNVKVVEIITDGVKTYEIKENVK